MAVRIFVLMAQYRKPIDFTKEAIAAATNGWKTLQEGLQFGYQYGLQLGWQSTEVDNHRRDGLDEEVIQRFETAMDSDFNSSSGLAVLFELAKELRREGNILVHQGKTTTPSAVMEKQWRTLVSLSAIFGLSIDAESIAGLKPEGVVEAGSNNESEMVESLIAQRREARKAKNFAESDRLRDLLKQQGITLIDQSDGTTRWHRN